MAQNGGRIEFQVGVREDQSSFKQLRQSLEQLSRIKLADFQGSEQELKQLKSTANEVQQALTKAFNVNLNSVNVTKFNEQIKLTVGNVDKIYNQFSKAGAQGKVAFSQMAQSVLTTNLQLKETTSLLDSMGTTMVNTVKWGIASSVMNTFTSSVQSAFSYVESLEKSLTDIRIVTGDSTQKMEQFAVQANKAAQALGRSTMDYTKSALTFYQQGLDDETVAARTEAVLKAQNITGAGQEMADYLTSVWNGYKVANEEAELYVDKLAAVADSSASNMSQLAIAMSKVASTANIMGVDADQLNAQLATVIATTRQAPESVGTAFKTIYTRLNDIKVGSEEAEVSLGNYSGAMAKLGFNVLDAAGNLRDTGQVMEQIGESWSDLSREQQVFIARTMGGQRQITQVMALFDNWNTYTKLLNTSLQSEGTLMEKNGRYMESLGAKMEQLGAAGERVKNGLIDTDSFKAVIELLTSATNLLGTFIEGIGGGGNALLALGSVATQVFGKQIAKQLNAVVTNFQNAHKNAQILRQDIEMTDTFGRSQGYQEDTITQMVDAKKEIQQYYSVLSNEQIKSYNNIVKQIGASKEQVLILEEQVKIAQQFTAAVQRAADESGVEFTNQLIHITDHAQNLKEALSSINGVRFLAQDQQNTEAVFEKIIDEVLELRGAIGDQAIPAFIQFDKKLEETTNNGEVTEQQWRQLRAIANQIFKQAYGKNGLAISLDQIKQKSKQATAELDLAKRKAEQITQSAKQLFDIKNITQMISSVGQLASGFNILSNMVNNVWTDKNISTGQKALKTIMAMTTALPMLINGYKMLKASSNGFITSLTNLITNLVSSKVFIYDETSALEVLMAAQSKFAVSSEVAAAAQMKFQAALAGIAPYAAGFIAFAAVLGAVRTALDRDTQALEEFNQKRKDFHSNDKIVQQNVSELKDLEKEYQELAKKADANNFDSNIDSLTEQERERYNYIKDLIASYNEDAVAGYNDQHEAILLNNSALEDTVALLKQKHQLEIDDVYGGQQYKKSYKNRRENYLDSRRESFSTVNPQQMEIDEASFNAASSAAMTALSQSGSSFEEEVSRILEIKKDGIENISNHNQELNQIYSKVMDQVKNNPALNQSDINWFENNINQMRAISDIYKQIDFDKEQANKELIQQAKIPAQEMIAYLQTTNNNKEYNKLAQQYGQEFLDSIIVSYVQGANQAGDGFTWDKFQNPEQYAKALQNGLLAPFLNLELTPNEISLIKDSAKNFNKTVPSLTLKEYNKGLQEVINGLYKNNKDFQKAAEENPKELSRLIAGAFKLNSLDFEIEEGQIKIKKAANAYTKTYEETIEKIKGLQRSSSEKNLLMDYANKANIYTLQNFDEILKQIGSDAKITEESLSDAARELNNINNFNVSTEAFSLLNKRDSGGKLTQEEFDALQKSLDSLKTTFPKITDQIDTLTEAQLKGTEKYNRALQVLKGTIFGTFGNIGKYTEDTLAQIGDVITNLDDLQNAVNQNPKLFEGENAEIGSQFYRDQLTKLALQYQSCKDELNQYLQAEGQAEELELKLAIKAEQAAAKYGIKAERVDDLSSHYAHLAEIYEKTGDAQYKEYQGLNESAELANDAAIANIRLNDSLADLYKNQEQYNKVLLLSKEGLEAIRTSEYSDAFDEILKDVAGIANVDLTQLDTEWVVDHLQMVMDAADGSQESVDRLRQALKEDMALDIATDAAEAKLDYTQEKILDFVNNLPKGQIDLDTNGWIQELVDMEWEAGRTAEQIESRFSQMGIHLQTAQIQQDYNEIAQGAAGVEQAAKQVFNNIVNAANQTSKSMVNALGVDTQVKADQKTQEDAQQFMGYTTDFQENSRQGSLPHTVNTTTENGQAVYQTEQVPTTFTVWDMITNPRPVTATATKQNTAIGLKVKAANNQAGGKISYSNTSAGRQALSKPKTSSTKSKKSSPKKSAKKSTPKVRGTKRKLSSSKKKKEQKEKDPEELKKLEDQKDRYHDINIQITKIEHHLTQVQQKQKKLVGKELSANLKEQLDILKDQVKAYEQKLAIARDEQSQLKDQLRGYGVSFDQNGAISNYASVLDSALADVNKKIQKYNNMTAEQQQNYKDVVENAKQNYEKLKELIERYDKLYSDEIPGLKQTINSLIDTQIEKQIQNFKINVQLELDFSEGLREWNKFKKQIIDQIRDDDIAGAIRAKVMDIFSYYSNTPDRLGEIPALTDQVSSTIAQLTQMDNEGWSSVYGNDRAKALEDLKEYSSKLMSSLENVDDLIKDIKKSFFDMTKQAQSAFDEQVKQYDFISNLIDHDKKLVEMLYGDKAYNMISKYYQKQEQIDKKELDFQKQQKDFWYAQMQAQKAQMSRFAEQSNEYKEAEQRFKDLEEHWLSAVSDFNSKVEQSISNLLDQYKNNVSIIFDDLNNKVTGGQGLDYVNEEWELINDNTDMYLDKINSMYEIEKLQNAYEDAIADAGDDLKAQQSLNDMMNQQLKYLREKDRLTQYDVDRANLLLQLETKRLALEQARQNKTQLRLRRDSQGNYTYQYVADEQQTNQAERGIAEVQNSIYNLDRNEYKSNLDSIYNLQTNFNDKMQELYNEYPVWTEQAEQKRRLLVEKYGQAINHLVDQNERIRLNLSDSAFNQLAKMYDTDVSNFVNMSQTERDELMQNLVPQWNSGIQTMADTFAGDGGFIPTCSDALDQLNENTGNYQGKLKELQIAAGQNFANIGKGIDPNIAKTEQLVENNDKLIGKWQLEAIEINNLINEVDNLTKAYGEAKAAAIAAATATQNALKGETGDKVDNPEGVANPELPDSSDGTDTPSSTPASKPVSTKTSLSSQTLQGIAAAAVVFPGSSGWGQDLEFRNNLFKKFDTETANRIFNQANIYNAEKINNPIKFDKKWLVRRPQLEKYYFSKFDTGGYTGQWGKTGKIGILHEKELVLNQKDTKNLLSAVNVVRTMDDLLQNISSKTGMSNNLSNLTRNISNSSLDQNVHITATFPNVTQHTEIEKAFDNLINRASQYAFSTRR